MKNLGVLAFMISGVMVIAIWTLQRSPFSTVNVSVGDKIWNLRQAGEGPDLVIITDSESERTWRALARAWSTTYRLTLISATSEAANILPAIQRDKVYLLSVGKQASLAMQLANLEGTPVRRLIFINPELKALPAMPPVQQLALVLIGRRSPPAIFQNLNELTRILRNSQMSFDAQGGADMVEQRADWVAAKVKAFIDFTSSGPNGS